ncbi:MAG: PEGA domain-containing protein [Bacteroidales bacterium]|nr:PEGA domain-containing protein [Bacteroidales bacterium]
MKTFYQKPSALFLAILLLATSCASTTLIESIPPGAKVYLNEDHVGQTPYLMTDTKIVGTCTYLKLELEGYETLYTDICRFEEVDVSAVVGGLFVWPLFLWSMKYYPVHTYELMPLNLETENMPAPGLSPSAKAAQLRELKSLLDEGIISQEEFDVEKKKVLEQ